MINNNANKLVNIIESYIGPLDNHHNYVWYDNKGTPVIKLIGNDYAAIEYTTYKTIEGLLNIGISNHEDLMTEVLSIYVKNITGKSMVDYFYI